MLPLIPILDKPVIEAVLPPNATVVLPNLTSAVAQLGAYPAPSERKNVPMAPAVIKVVTLVSC